MDQPLNIEAIGSEPATGQAGTHFTPRPTRLGGLSQSPATATLMVISLVVYLLTTFSGGSENVETLLEFGASYAPLVSHGQYWRLVTPMFLHAGPAHLLLNMLVLYTLGILAEPLYGYGRFTLIYVASGMGGSILSVWRSLSVAVGASGALMGIAGALIVVGWRYGEDLPPRLRRLLARLLPPLILLELASGWVLTKLVKIVPFLGHHFAGVDNWAHLGGLLTGLLLAALIPVPERKTLWTRLFPATPRKPRFEALVLVPVAVVALAFTAAVRYDRNSAQASKLVEDGARLDQAGQTARALELWRQAARLDPYDERPHEEIGLAELKHGQTAEAMREYQQALALNPNSPRAKLGLASAYRDSGDYDRSKQLYEAVFGKDPPSAEDQVLLGTIASEQKLYPEAVRHYQEALGFDQNLAVAHNNLAWLYATSDDARFRDLRGALEHALLAVELSRGKQPEFLDTLAEAYYANGDYRQAVETETRTLALDPNNLVYQDHMVRYRKAAGVP